MKYTKPVDDKGNCEPGWDSDGNGVCYERICDSDDRHDWNSMRIMFMQGERYIG